MVRIFGPFLAILFLAGVQLPASAGGHLSSERTIPTNAVKADNLKTLVAALQAADLIEALEGEGPFTLFAPTDDAFAKLPDGTVEDLLKPENKDQLTSILTYHVVPGKIISSDLAGKQTTAKTLQGGEVQIDASNGVKVDEATVITADIESSNGVIHIVDTVIMPNS